MPGAEFQLSAPYAVCLVAGVGFWRYLGIGVCASLVQLMMGTHTPWNVLVAMVFRVAAGLIVSLLPGKTWAMVLAGPVGTGCAGWCWPAYWECRCCLCWVQQYLGWYSPECA